MDTKNNSLKLCVIASQAVLFLHFALKRISFFMVKIAHSSVQWRARPHSKKAKKKTTIKSNVMTRYAKCVMKFNLCTLFLFLMLCNHSTEWLSMKFWCLRVELFVKRKPLLVLSHKNLVKYGSKRFFWNNVTFLA